MVRARPTTFLASEARSRARHATVTARRATDRTTDRLKARTTDRTTDRATTAGARAWTWGVRSPTILLRATRKDPRVQKGRKAPARQSRRRTRRTLAIRIQPSKPEPAHLVWRLWFVHIFV